MSPNGHHIHAKAADAELSLDMEAMGAVLITGPKWCGKTTTAMQVAKSVVNVDDLIMDVRTSGIGEIAPESLLRGGGEASSHR